MLLLYINNCIRIIRRNNMCDSVLGNKFNTISDAGKKIILTPSLFMRLLEWAKEDAKDDIALHQVFEKIMAFTDGTNPVGIECYDSLIKDATGSSLSDEKDDNTNTECAGDYWCEQPCEAPQVCCDDVECVAPSCLQNITPSPEAITITCTDDCCAPECCEQPEECVYDDEIAKIIKIGQL